MKSYLFLQSEWKTRNQSKKYIGTPQLLNAHFKRHVDYMPHCLRCFIGNIFLKKNSAQGLQIYVVTGRISLLAQATLNQIALLLLHCSHIAGE